MAVSNPCLNLVWRKLATVVIHEQDILPGPTKFVAVRRSDDIAEL